jgi:Tfp pilus assembly protein PilX
MAPGKYFAGNESGTVLVIAMLTLAILSLIGVAATPSSSIEAGISGNDRVHKEAFFATEYGLTIGERVLQALIKRQDFDEGATVGHFGEGDQPLWNALKWDSSDSVTSVGTIPDGLSYVAAQPQYTLEQRSYKRDNLTLGIGVPTGVYQFNVTSRGRGSHVNAEVILHSIYAKRFD